MRFDLRRPRDCAGLTDREHETLYRGGALIAVEKRTHKHLSREERMRLAVECGVIPSAKSAAPRVRAIMGVTDSLE